MLYVCQAIGLIVKRLASKTVYVTGGHIEPLNTVFNITTLYCIDRGCLFLEQLLS